MCTTANVNAAIEWPPADIEVDDDPKKNLIYFVLFEVINSSIKLVTTCDIKNFLARSSWLVFSFAKDHRNKDQFEERNCVLRLLIIP